jgi:hypothetical protein
MRFHYWVFLIILPNTLFRKVIRFTKSMCESLSSRRMLDEILISEGRSQLSGMLVEIAKKNQPSLIKISSSIRLLDKDSHIDLVNRITLRNSVLGNIIKNTQ